VQVPAPPGGQGPAEPGDIMIGGDLGRVDEQGRFPGGGHLRARRGPPGGLAVPPTVGAFRPGLGVPLDFAEVGLALVHIMPMSVHSVQG
jgi:hypothetical protein